MENSFAPVLTPESVACPAPPALDFELPTDPDFVSRPPFIEPQAMLRRCEEMLPFRNARPGEPERRLSEKISVEFVL